MRRWVLFFALAFPGSLPAQAPAPLNVKWYEVKDKKVQINLYMFYSQTCSHCDKAMTFVNAMENRQPWIKVTRYEVTTYPQNMEYYRQMAQSIGQVAGQVPAFFHCKQLEIGYITDDTSGDRLEKALIRCRDALQKQLDAAEQKKQEKEKEREKKPGTALLFRGSSEFLSDEPELELPPPEAPKVAVPGWGEVSTADMSLPVLTIVLGGLDAFNPCAFFVLMILLSLILHSGSRGRMILVGGVFVAISGIVYFLFMAAWLNLFFLFGHMRWITLAAGVLAVVVALINIKDFFWFKGGGVTLSIPESVKPGLYQRMNVLMREGNLIPLLVGTAALAFATNAYELLCTSGLPLVYTRVLTLREMPPAGFYGYLVLYNVVYVFPLFLIVVAFSLTLSNHKMTEYQGRVLKLLSGMMMLALGVLLIARPDTLNTLGGAAGTLGIAIGGTALVAVAHRLLARS
ncbi:MAG: hypothetical protein K1X57_20800 [Gemmataceae bacterium]|nr:hypothetical protein [Gemmataceae bacterium]